MPELLPAFSSSDYLTDTPLSRVQPMPTDLFSAKLSLDSVIMGCLHQPRIAHQRANHWHTDGSLQPDVTPFSAYIAPRSSDPRFRPWGSFVPVGVFSMGRDTTCATHEALGYRRAPARHDAVLSLGRTRRTYLQGDTYEPYRLEDRCPRLCVHAGPRATRDGATGPVPATAPPWHPDGSGQTRRGRGRGARARQEGGPEGAGGTRA